LHRSAIAAFLGAFLAAVLGTPGLSAPAVAAPCEKTVAAQLERLQIDPDNVRDIAYQRRIRTSRNGAHIVGYEAWVGLANCRGSLVIGMSRRCRVKQVYSRGDCRVPGVPAY